MKMATRINRAILILSVAVFSLNSGCASETSMEDQIEKLVRERVEKDEFSGAVLVAAGGKRLFAGAFGYADRENKTRNSLEARFNIGSIGKVFTGTLVMRLVQEGRVNLTDPIGKYLPGYPGEAWGEIQVGQLLNHSSGLGNYMEHPDYRSNKDGLREIGDVLPLIYGEALRFEPGTEHGYSNSGMVVAGAVIEAVTGKSYADSLRQYILDPTGMSSTGIVYREDDIPDRAIGYHKTGGNSYSDERLNEPPAFSDGGIYSTVLDMLRFDRALYAENLLHKRYKDEMFTPVGPDKYAGYGWGVVMWGGTIVINHSGKCPGFNADFRRYPEKDMTIIVLSNYDEGSFDLTNEIEEVLLGLSG